MTCCPSRAKELRVAAAGRRLLLLSLSPILAAVSHYQTLGAAALGNHQPRAMANEASFDHPREAWDMDCHLFGHLLETIPQATTAFAMAEVVGS